ncbi:hypothetical protein FPHOBKDP_00127 [Listeria phage LPJP1]|nr:hypothetical protein FPHOBKDP_00127 [Listeria phage LPJP1]
MLRISEELKHEIDSTYLNDNFDLKSICMKYKVPVGVVNLYIDESGLFDKKMKISYDNKTKNNKKNKNISEAKIVDNIILNNINKLNPNKVTLEEISELSGFSYDQSKLYSMLKGIRITEENKVKNNYINYNEFIQLIFIENLSLDDILLYCNIPFNTINELNIKNNIKIPTKKSIVKSIKNYRKMNDIDIISLVLNKNLDNYNTILDSFKEYLKDNKLIFNDGSTDSIEKNIIKSYNQLKKKFSFVTNMDIFYDIGVGYIYSVNNIIKNNKELYNKIYIITNLEHSIICDIRNDYHYGKKINTKTSISENCINILEKELSIKIKLIYDNKVMVDALYIIYPKDIDEFIINTYLKLSTKKDIITNLDIFNNIKSKTYSVDINIINKVIRNNIKKMKNAFILSLNNTEVINNFKKEELLSRNIIINTIDEIKNMNNFIKNNNIKVNTVNNNIKVNTVMEDIDTTVTNVFVYGFNIRRRYTKLKLNTFFKKYMTYFSLDDEKIKYLTKYIERNYDEGKYDDIINNTKLNKDIVIYLNSLLNNKTTSIDNPPSWKKYVDIIFNMEVKDCNLIVKRISRLSYILDIINKKNISSVYSLANELSVDKSNIKKYINNNSLFFKELKSANRQYDHYTAKNKCISERKRLIDKYLDDNYSTNDVSIIMNIPYHEMENILKKKRKKEI